MNLKWLAEIVHSNPAGLNPETAKKFGLRDADWIEITSFHSQMLEDVSSHLFEGDKRKGEKIEKDKSGRLIVSRMRVPIVTMPGIHPRAIAMSNSCGHWQYTDVAKAKNEV